jgi:hypothetical protein
MLRLLRDGVRYKRELIRLPDGGTIALDHDMHFGGEDAGDPRPVLVVLSGVLGDRAPLPCYRRPARAFPSPLSSRLSGLPSPRPSCSLALSLQRAHLAHYGLPVSVVHCASPHSQ